MSSYHDFKKNCHNSSPVKEVEFECNGQFPHLPHGTHLRAYLLVFKNLLVVLNWPFKGNITYLKKPAGFQFSKEGATKLVDCQWVEACWQDYLLRENVLEVPTLI